MHFQNCSSRLSTKYSFNRIYLTSPSFAIKLVTKQTSGDAVICRFSCCLLVMWSELLTDDTFNITFSNKIKVFCLFHLLSKTRIIYHGPFRNLWWQKFWTIRILTLWISTHCCGKEFDVSFDTGNQSQYAIRQNLDSVKSGSAPETDHSSIKIAFRSKRLSGTAKVVGSTMYTFLSSCW